MANDYGINRLPRPYPSKFVQQQKDRVYYLFSLNVEQFIAAVGKQVGDAIESVSWSSFSNIGEFAKDFEYAAGSRRSFATAHRRAGEAAQHSVLRTYEENVEGQKRIHDPYRAKDRRFTGGKLRRVLQAPDFVNSSSKGVSIINMQRLDAEAPQWSRLNYGAGTGIGKRGFIGGGYGPAVKSNMARYLKRGTVGLLSDEVGPRPAIKIPWGFWVTPDGKLVPPGDITAGFYPYSKAIRRKAIRAIQSDTNDMSHKGAVGRTTRATQRLLRGYIQRPTTGDIGARRFLDAGIRTLYKELGKEYDLMLENWRKMALRPKPIGAHARRIGTFVGKNS